jgi:valyl-tRNA synthetase
VHYGVEITKPPHSVTAVVGTTELFFPLEGLLDVEQEKQRLETQRRDVSNHIKKIEAQLHNPDFLANAPQEVVQRHMDRAEELRREHKK